MKGSTTIKFNQATMTEAVQMYLDAQLSVKHKVASVKAFATGSGYSNEGCFDVEFSDIEVGVGNG